MTPLTATLPAIHSFVKRYSITYPTLIDPKEVLVRRYGFRAYPATVLIDRRGRMHFTHAGFRAGDGKILESHISTLIAGPAGRSG